MYLGLTLGRGFGKDSDVKGKSGRAPIVEIMLGT